MQAFFLTDKISNIIRLDYEQNIQSLTETHALALERKIKEYRREIRMYTENENIKYSDLETAAKWLNEAIPLRDKNYKQILVADIDGNFIADDLVTRGSIRQYAFYDAILHEKDGEDKYIDDVIVDSGEAPFFFVARAIKNDKKIVGFIAIKIKADHLQKQVNKAKLGEHGYAWLMTADGTIVSHPNEDWQLKKNFAKNVEPGFEDLTDVVNSALQRESGLSWVKGINGGKDLVCYAPIDETPWVLAFTVESEQVNASVVALKVLLAITSCIVGAVTLIILGIITAKALTPLRTLEKRINNIASGNADLTNRIELNSRNEIGSVVNGFNNFTKKLHEIISDVKNSNSDLNKAGENLKISSEETVKEINHIQSNIDNVHEQIINQSAKVEETAGAVNEVAANIESLEKMIETQSSEVVQASTAVEKMIGNINSVDEVVLKISDAFAGLLQKSESGTLKQNDVNKQIENIKEQSNTLGEANKSIQNIASQTNLLAMNAAIEAAHAGEAGKGFSVVADEIRKLSETSSKQSKTIGEELKSIQKAIDGVVTASIESIQAFNVVTSEIKSTDELIRQIKIAMEEQKNDSSMITRSLTSMNDRTLEVKTASNEMNIGNKTILEEIKALQNITGVIKEAMGQIKEASGKVYDTGNRLSEISVQVQSSIERTGNQIDQFTV
ncbi:MAG: HAMP domain-containing protein [Treponema sp.]|nr:HAMP domain-containing protein [Treponema sp.]